MAAAEEIRNRVPALRQISAQHVAAITREYMLAGWTLRDILHALDHRPDGRPHGHDVDGRWMAYTAADGIPAGRLGHWMRHRLDHWRDAAGTVVLSPTQTTHQARVRAAAERAGRRHEAEARRQRREAVTAEEKAAIATIIDGIHEMTQTRPRRRGPGARR